MNPCDFDLFVKLKLPLKEFPLNQQAIIAAVEQSVRRLVQQGAVNGIRRLLDVRMRVLNFRGEHV